MAGDVCECVREREREREIERERERERAGDCVVGAGQESKVIALRASAAREPWGTGVAARAPRAPGMAVLPRPRLLL